MRCHIRGYNYSCCHINTLSELIATKIYDALLRFKNHHYFCQDFEEYRDADDAVYELHGRELLGERVIVEHAKGPSGRSQRSSRAPKPTWLEK